MTYEKQRREAEVSLEYNNNDNKGREVSTVSINY